MAAEPWNRIKELFDAALSHPAEQRADFVRQACPDDPRVRREVEELLECAGDDSFLETSPIAAVRSGLLKPGARLGSFEIVELLGKGGMGEVYRARDLRLNRYVAIKILPPEFARDAERNQRFEREARATSALSHPNILSIYDIGREGGLSWIVCELVEGHSLRHLLANGPVRAATALEIAAQIADGLAAAHAAGVVHRDLKAENVMLTRDERVKILDFGLAKWHTPAANGGSAGLTGDTGIVGTPYGMSPEQVLGAAVDGRSDLFSLGTLLYEMLAGKRPFAGETSIAVMNAIVHAEPEDLPACVPEPAARIVRRCLAKAPERRFQSAADLAFGLRMAQAAAGRIPAPALPARRRWPAIAAAALILIIALAAGALLRPGKPGAAQERAFPGALRRLTWHEGLNIDGAISPDGKLVAYSSDWANPGSVDIYVQQVDGGGTVRLTADPADETEPTFSPDGGRVAFESSRDGGGIFEIPALGGQARLLVAGGRHPRFSPDGRFLLYSTGDVSYFRDSKYSALGGRLWVRALAGGDPVLISKGCEAVVSLGVWSPDSERVLFSGRCMGRNGVWLARRGGDASLQPAQLEIFGLSSGLRSPAGLTPVFDQWLADPPRLLLPAVARHTAYEATLPVSADGTRALGPLHRLTFGPEPAAQGSASRDGRVALSFVRHSSNIWRLPIDAEGHATNAPAQITTEQSMCVYPVLSPDGQHVAFVSIHGSGIAGGDMSSGMAGEHELRVLNLPTGTAAVATRSDYEISNPLFSADGRITYLAAPVPAPEGPQPRATFEVGTHGGVEQKILPEDAGALTDWSRDGNFCLSAMGHRSSHVVISMVDRRTLQQTRILEDAEGSIFEAKLSADGEWVTFMAVRNRRSRLYIARFRRHLIPVNDWIAVTAGDAWDDKPRLSVDGRHLFFVSDRDGFRCLWMQRLAADRHPQGGPEAVYHFHSAKRSLAQESLAYLGLAAGTGVLVFNQGETTGDIWLLDPNAGQ